ncbi:hypothetical protein CLV78_11546 [Aliiruegeria haliotis]|uniref:Uncharacterized protein n=1 Tax=Aliiruegeria haliotis TaxID=1280846 RepID=A0A2T0RG18_9RHOB|nr:hypothetical protein [Aliiruegeria haliotis]PRY20097.1 hypothetical protein CLV78_11546 [Aliiruegeria haliotis]
MRQLFKIVALSASTILLATATFATGGGYSEVTDKASFEEKFVGVKIMDPEDDANYFVVRDDGSIEGVWNGKELKGEWRWEDTYFCRSLSAPRPAPEDCQSWSISEGKARLVRNRGDGDETIYALGK